MHQPANNADMSPVIAEMKALKAAFKQGQTQYSVNWNSNNEAVERITQNKVTKIIKHKGRRL